MNSIHRRASRTSFCCNLSSSGCHELNVSKLQNARQKFENVPDLFRTESHHFKSSLLKRDLKSVIQPPLRDTGSYPGPLENYLVLIAPPFPAQKPGSCCLKRQSRTHQPEHIILLNYVEFITIKAQLGLSYITLMSSGSAKLNGFSILTRQGSLSCHKETP